MAWSASAWNAKAWALPGTSIENQIGDLHRNIAVSFDALLALPGKPNPTKTLRTAMANVLKFAAAKAAAP